MNRNYPGLLSGKSIALLKGGPGKERGVSLNSGAAVAKALRSLGAEVDEIDVTAHHFNLLSAPDLVFNMIHGTFGEDGELQSILDGLGIPYTGEDEAGSRLAFDKIATKRKFDEAATAAVQTAALAAHRALGLRVYSRVDVLLDANNRPFVLEVNTIPGMTETSLLPKAAAVAGLDFASLCEEIAGLSLEKSPAA